MLQYGKAHGEKIIEVIANVAESEFSLFVRNRAPAVHNFEIP
jgi:hypothetical protein